MGRKKITRSIVSDKKAKTIKDQYGEDHILVIEEKTYYSFTNLRRGPMFFKRENGKEDFFDGNETKNDITDRERELLMNTLDWKNGWIVEEKEFLPSTESEIINKNAISDSSLKNLVKANVQDLKKLESLIKEMTSEFALQRLKTIIVEENLPSSLVILCDYNLQKIEEAALEDKKAPIDNGESNE